MNMRTWPWRLLATFFATVVPGLACAAIHSGDGGSSGVTVEAVDGGLSVVLGEVSFGLLTGPAATVNWVDVDGKRVVDDNREPLLRARLMESASYDGSVDFVADRRFIDGRYEVTKVDYSVDGGHFSATLIGALHFGAGDSFPFEIRMSAVGGQPHIGVNVKLEAQGEFRQRSVRDIVLQMPLALDWRKRIAQGGDQGLEWDTRYYYEFPGRSGILALPDRNEFRYFGVEQDAATHFRIWRAESSLTPEMTHQHGLQAAGWTSVYDRFGGVLFAYRNMAAAAPKTLEVYAPAGGEARVWIYPESAPAFFPADSSTAAAVFNRWHETDWIYYLGEHPDADPVQLLADLWQQPQPLIGNRPERGKLDLWDADIELWQAPPAPIDAAPYVSGGIPIRRGEMQPGDAVVLSGPGGAYPCQTRVLAYWPDGSVKWLHLVFPIDGAVAPLADTLAVPGDSAMETFDVTFRAGETQSFTLYRSASLEPVLPVEQVSVSTLSADPDGQPQSVRVDTGVAQISVGLGEHWLPDVSIGGRAVWRSGSGGATAFVDFVRLDGP